MLILEMLRWWYGAGWSMVWKRTTAKISDVAQSFSVSLLLRTLFSPWRRIVTPRGKGFDAAIRGKIENAIGRFVGFFVRFFVLIGAAVMTVVLVAFGMAAMAVWPFMPLLAVGSVVWGIIK